MSYDHTIKKGTTSKIIEIMLRDAATGQGKTGLATGDMGGAYVREGGTSVSLSFSAGSAGDAYSSGKWAEVDSTNMAGLYQFHLPNAALASGVDAVTITFSATGVLTKVLRISLIDVDLRDATDAGLSNLDAAISSRSTVAATDIVSSGAITTSGGAVSNVTTVGTVTNAVTTDSASRTASQADVSTLATSSALTIVDTVVDAIKVVTDKLNGMLVIDGAVYQFTTNALENAPTGSGGGGGDTKEDIYTYFTTSSRQDTFKADVSSLSTFDAGSDTVTVSQNNDKTGYSISGTKTTLDDLNDIAATSIVSAGAINTASGAVSTVNNVVLCATTTTNSDMRGTDNALLASSAPTNFNAMTITAGGALTVGTNNDKTNYSISGTKTTLDDLTDISQAQVNAEVDTALSDIGLDHLVSASVAGTDVADNSIVAKLVSSAATADWDTFVNTDDSLQAIRDRGDSTWTPSGGLTAADIADAVLDEALSGHVTDGTLGKAIADIESDATAILQDTETTLPASIATIDTEVGNIQTDVTAIANDTSTIITNLSSLDGKVDTVDGIVDSILEDTETTIPATLSTLSTLTEAGVRTAVGLASANLDTQLGNIPTVTEFNARTLVSSDYFDPTQDSVTVGTNNDKTDYALSAASREAIGDDFLSHVITKGSAGTIERAFWQALKANAALDGEIEGTPTASAFDTSLTLVDDAVEHLMLVIVSGSLSGEARPILSYSQTNGRIVLQEALTAAPSSGDEFLVLPYHVHPISEITDATWNAASSSYTTEGTFGYYVDAQISASGGGATAEAIADAVWDESRAGHTTAGTFGYYLDDRVSQVGGGGGASASDIWGALLSDYAVAGTFGGRFQDADRYTNTSANIIYVNQGDAYDDTANNAIEWAVSKDYSGADSLTLVIEHRVTGATLLSHTVTYINATTLKAYLSSADTAFSTLTTDADFGVHPYRVEADYAGEVQSAVRGAVTIRRS